MTLVLLWIIVVLIINTALLGFILSDDIDPR